MKKDKYNIADNENYLDSASANDCTGLIPSGIQSEEELDSYKDIYKFSPAQVNEDCQSKKNN